MTKSALAIRHVAFEDLGTLEPLLAGRGCEIRYVEAGLDDLSGLDPLAPDIVISLGGPMGVWEDDAYPWIRGEVALLEKRLAAERPTLGVCLGCQMMARALGEKVYPGPAKELGWASLRLSEAGAASPLGRVGEAAVLHWHGDTFDLPAGADLLASTEAVTNQAFAVGAHGLALQFHLEVTVANAERWFIGHAVEIAATHGVDVPGLRAATAKHGPAMEALGRQVFQDWLEGAGL